MEEKSSNKSDNGLESAQLDDEKRARFERTQKQNAAYFRALGRERRLRDERDAELNRKPN